MALKGPTCGGGRGGGRWRGECKRVAKQLAKQPLQRHVRAAGSVAAVRLVVWMLDSEVPPFRVASASCCGGGDGRALRQTSRRLVDMCKEARRTIDEECLVSVIARLVAEMPRPERRLVAARTATLRPAAPALKQRHDEWLRARSLHVAAVRGGGGRRLGGRCRQELLLNPKTSG